MIISQTEYHRGPAILPHVANLLPHQRLAQSFFIPDNLNEQLIKRQEIALQTKTGWIKNDRLNGDNSNKMIEKELPEEVHVYHSLCLLEENPGKFFGHPSWIYKAISRANGQQYIMIRIEGKQHEKKSREERRKNEHVWQVFDQ